MTRRRFLKGAMAAAVLGTVGADALFIEPRGLAARRVDIHLDRLPEAFHGFRIALISDIHFGPYMGRAGVKRALDLAATFHPDLLALTGDFVSAPLGQSDGPKGAHHIAPCADVIAEFKDAPKAAVLGNHDHWNGAGTVASGLEERGVTVLRNGNFVLERGQARLWIAGVDDVFVKAADLRGALSGVPATEATVLLAHEPDFADHVASFPVDLQLSGHSHGGQVRLPGLGALVLPAMGRKYPVGVNRVGQLQVYTNVGLGVIGPPVRFLCPPEVTFMTLVVGRGSSRLA